MPCNRKSSGRTMNLNCLILSLLLNMFIPNDLEAQNTTPDEFKVEKNPVVLLHELANLAADEQMIGNQALAETVAKMYFSNYLDTLNDSCLFTPANLQFICKFPELIRSKDRIFNFFYTYPELAEEIIGYRRGYSEDLVRYIIQRDEIDAYLYKNDRVLIKRPNWGYMSRSISLKYNQGYANSLIPGSKSNFYRISGNWRKYACLFEQKIKQYPPIKESNRLGGMFGDSWTINHYAWDIFLHCADRKVLKMAVKWSDLSISLCKTELDAVQYLDTKANLLYKLGNFELAVQYEERALALNATSNEYKSNLEKMRSARPTWPPK